MYRPLSLRDDTMIVLLSQTKLPDPSNPLSDIVRAVHTTIFVVARLAQLKTIYVSLKFIACTKKRVAH